MIDILLISPSNEKLGLFHSFVPRSVPIGLGILASYVLKFDYNTEIIDEEITKIDEIFLKNKMQQMETPRIFGISVMTTNASKAYKIAQMIKTLDKDSFVLLGGIHPTVMPEEALQTGYVDFVVIAEGERATLQLINKIKNDEKDFSTIKNIVFVDENKQITHTEPEKEPFNVNDLPTFPYHLFNSKHYDLGFILSSRGCPFNCIFCSQRAITKGRYTPRSIELVMEELSYLINNENPQNIIFLDDFFLGDKKRVSKLCTAIKEKEFHNKCTFAVQTRADSISKEILLEMKEAGFNSLMFGFETSSNHLMKIINKHETVEANIEAIKLAKELGFLTEATFIFGFPEETYEDRIKAFKIAREIGLDRARFNNATPYPGTEFYNIAVSTKKLNKNNDWENFSSVGALTSGLFKPYQVPYCPDGTDPKALVGEAFLANLLFYLNFDKLKALFNVNKKASGKWFELPKSNIFNFSLIFKLILLGIVVILKANYFIISSKECRAFFVDSFNSERIGN